MTVSTLFEPINRAHAVVETVFFFELLDRVLHDEGFPNKIKSALNDFFNKAEVAPSVEFTFDLATGATLQKSSDALNFTRGDPSDGSVSWVLRVNGVHVSLHCVEYTRWDAVYASAKMVLAKVFKLLREDNGILSFGMKVIDRFDYLGSEEEFNISELLSERSRYLPVNLFSSRNRWHVNSGWFVAYQNAIEVLHQLALDSSIHTDELGNFKNFITIDHTATFKTLNPIVREPAVHAPFDEQALGFIDAAFHHLHLENKRVMIDLLRSEVSRKLNISARAV